MEWLAGQPWCDGAVGMWGISYGGFTSIQVAKLRPPHLARDRPGAWPPTTATSTTSTTVGGCVTASELSQYAVSQVGDERDAARSQRSGATPGATEWLARLEATPPWLIEWLRQQTRRPVLATGVAGARLRARSRRRSSTSAAGWTRTSTRRSGCRPRCTAPSRTIVGNWVHGLAADGDAGPEPRRAPRARRASSTAGSSGWPTAPTTSRRSSGSSASTPPPSRSRRTCPAAGGRRRRTRIRSHDAGVAARRRCAAARRPAGAAAGGDRPRRRGPRRAGVDRFRHHPTVGTRGALSWGAGGPPNGLARDLRPDEALGPTYTSEPLVDALEILGVPEVVLHLAVSAPVATAVVRLTDVAPDGTSAQVSAGILNLTHRRSHEHPEPLEPGRVESIRIAMRPAGYRFAPGHRIRVSLASSRVAGRLAVAARGRVRGPSRGRRRHRASSCRSSRRPAARATSRSRRSRRRRPTSLHDRRRRAARTTPSGGSRTTSSPARVTVTIHDGGEDVLDDGRRLYAAETLTADRLRRRSRARDPRCRRRLPLARATTTLDRDPRPLHPDQRRLGVPAERRPRGRPRRRAVLPADLGRDRRAAARLTGPPT